MDMSTVAKDNMGLLGMGRSIFKLALEYPKDEREHDNWGQKQRMRRALESWLQVPLNLRREGGNACAFRYRNDHKIMDMAEDLLKLVLTKASKGDQEDWLRFPMESALRSGNVDMVTQMLDRSAFPASGEYTSSKYDQGMTSLHIAAVSDGDNAALVKALLERGAKEDMDILVFDKTIEGDLSSEDNEDDITQHYRLIREEEEGRNTGTHQSPLHSAAYVGNVDVVEALVEAGAKVDRLNFDGDSPLLYAMQCGHSDIVRVLLVHGANPNSSLGAANQTFDPASAELLMKAGPDPHSREHGTLRTPLHSAAEGMPTEVVASLLAAGADPDAEDAEGQTPLHRATQGSWRATLEHARMLVAAGADVDAQDTKGRTPLRLACEKDCEELVEVLLDLGADETVEDNDGKTPTASIQAALKRIDAASTRKKRPRKNRLPGPDSFPNKEEKRRILEMLAKISKTRAVSSQVTGDNATGSSDGSSCASRGDADSES